LQTKMSEGFLKISQTSFFIEKAFSQQKNCFCFN